MGVARFCGLSDILLCAGLVAARAGWVTGHLGWILTVVVGCLSALEIVKA